MLSIHPYNDGSRYDGELFVLLPSQVQAYLYKLINFPALQKLSDCAPYDDCRFTAEQTTDMCRELVNLKKIVKDKKIDPPPEFVSNSPGEIADEEFGWSGFLNFCICLEKVLNAGIENKTGIISIGD